ncbi:MAG: hypothetical protein M1831_005763 [Alyxoria varia]|nr:MAG: hypothetical protein M1831_005763 [Alyxoria varia]
MSSTGAGWSQLRQQARQQETQTEQLLQKYSQFASLTNIPAQPTDDEKELESQIQDLLEKRNTTLNSLNRVLQSSPDPQQQQQQQSSSALKSSHLTRHTQIQSQHRSDLARLTSQTHDHRNRSNLLSTVRRDIDQYRSSHSTDQSSQNPEAAESEYMLQERTRLDDSHNMTDSLLSQAYAVNESFGVQREQLERVRVRALQAAGMVPGVNGLIARIGGKKRRDGVIMGVFVAICFLAVWFFR